MKYLVEIVTTVILIIIISYFLYMSIKFNTGGPSKPPDEKCEKYLNDLLRNQPQWHAALWFAIPISLLLFFIYYFIVKTNNCKVSYLSLIFVFTLLISIIFTSNCFLLNLFSQHYIAWWYSNK